MIKKYLRENTAKLSNCYVNFLTEIAENEPYKPEDLQYNTCFQNSRHTADIAGYRGNVEKKVWAENPNDQGT